MSRKCFKAIMATLVSSSCIFSDMEACHENDGTKYFERIIYFTRCPNFPNSGHVTTPSEDQLFLNVEAFCDKNLLELKISVKGNCIFLAFLDYEPLFTKETFP